MNQNYNNQSGHREMNNHPNRGGAIRGTQNNYHHHGYYQYNGNQSSYRGRNNYRNRGMGTASNQNNYHHRNYDNHYYEYNDNQNGYRPRNNYMNGVFMHQMQCNQMEPILDHHNNYCNNYHEHNHNQQYYRQHLQHHNYNDNSCNDQNQKYQNCKNNEPQYQQKHCYNNSMNTKNNKTTGRTVIGKFDTKRILQKRTQKDIEFQTKQLIYYHTDPVNKLLRFDDTIKPFLVKSDNIEWIKKLDFNQIPIDYSTLKNKGQNNKKQRFVYSLSQQHPPKQCEKRIDPFCYEIQKIDKEMKMNDNGNGNNDNYKDSKTKKEEKIRFITYRHNLRAIANVVLSKLTRFRIFDKCGINIGIHRNGNDIILENISEVNEEKNEPFSDVYSVYGYLLEHTLRSLSNNNSKDIKGTNIKPMDYSKSCLNRDEIRSLNKLQIDNDIEILCAAEMDAITKSSIIELKCCKIQNIKWRNKSKVPEIADFKLLKYWTQCKFGGVDSVVIAFHEKGIVQKTCTLTTSEIEALFPVITKKCVEMVHEILKWLRNIIIPLAENNLYLLSFDTNKQNNTEFILKYLSSKETEKKVFEILSDKNENVKDKLLNHGLIISPQTKKVELRKVL